MTVRLSPAMEELLRRYAAAHGGDIDRIVEDALRRYIDATEITDVGGADSGEAQMRLLGELGLPDEAWADDEGDGARATG